MATMNIYETNTGAAVSTAISSNINFGSVDDKELNTLAYPITAGESSYEKWVYMNFTIGTANRISNLKVYRNDAVTYKTGESIKCNLSTDQTTYTSHAKLNPAGYIQPTSETSTIALQDIPTAEPASANLGIGGQLDGELTTDGVSDYVVLQMQTTTGTPAGNVNQKIIRFQYDEQ